MKRNAFIILLFGILALALLAGCGLTGHNGRSHGSRTGLQDATGTDVYTYDLPENARELTLKVEVNATAGSYQWQVTDPDGNIAWEGSLEADDSYNETKTLELIPGTWTLDVQTEQAGGSYDIEWRSR